MCTTILTNIYNIDYEFAGLGQTPQILTNRIGAGRFIVSIMDGRPTIPSGVGLHDIWDSYYAFMEFP